MVTKGDKVLVHVRWMIRRDMSEVLDIENGCCDEDSYYGDVWTEGDYVRALRQRNCHGHVSEFDEKIIGFMIIELHKKRFDIVRFAVDPEYLHRNVGTQMIERLKKKLVSGRRKEIRILVRESSLLAQKFLRHCDFKAVKILRNYCSTDNGFEDAYMMKYKCDQVAVVRQNRISPSKQRGNNR